MGEWLKKHPRLSAIGGVAMLIAGGLATIQGIWNLFSNEPLFPYIAKTIPLWPRIILLIIFCGITVFGIVLVIRIFQRTGKTIHNKVENEIQPIIVARDTDNMVTGPTPAGHMAKPSVMVKANRSKLIELNDKILIEVSLLLHATLPAKFNSVRLEVLGRFLHESTDRFQGWEIGSTSGGNAWFLKPNGAAGKPKARIWVNAAEQEWVSDEFTVDFDQQIELRN